MNQHLTESQLNDYIDGAVDAHSRANIEAHHAGCAICRSELQAMRSLVAEIGELPTQIAPSRDLRAGIAERIARAEHHNVPAVRGAERVMRRARYLAAAAVLVLATATLTRWWVLRETSDTSAAPALPPASSALPTASSALLPVTFRTEEARYHDAIAELQHTLERSRAELAPQTIAILERNLSIIDRAIAESRAALAQDPANRDLGQMVLSAYEQKLQLLQRARVSVL